MVEINSALHCADIVFLARFVGHFLCLEEFKDALTGGSCTLQALHGLGDL